jgi:hypothetical protein
MVENLQVAGLSLVQSLAGGFLTTNNHANRELCDKAQAELVADRNVLLNSKVALAKRSEGDGVRLVVTTPTGKKLIIAKRLLVTIPPKISSMKTLDLDSQEKAVFSKFVNAGYYTSMVSNTGIPVNLLVYNGDSHTPYNLPKLPGVYSFQQTNVPGLHTAYYF